MIRPISFRMNEDTVKSNYFQKSINSLSNKEIQNEALKEFDNFVVKLRKNGVNVIVVDDNNNFDTPDSIFPNNWNSFHKNGNIGIYPMFAENRRNERREDVFDTLEQEGFIINNFIDYTSAEDEHLFLEGTGCLVLDRVNRKAYCGLSSRANEELLIEFCEDFEYTPVPFIAYQNANNSRLPIYHTNVMMCVAENFVIICLDCIDDKKERKNVVNHLKKDNKEIISISEKQLESFAGNMLQVVGKNDNRILVMSESAYSSLTKNQIERINKHCEIIYSPLNTIERCGGGSARCMMAEIFLPSGQ